MATYAALADVVKNVGMNALGGALSGGVMGAGYQAIGALNNRSLNPFEGQDINETVEQPSLNPFEKQNDVQATAETVSQPSLNPFESRNKIDSKTKTDESISINPQIHSEEQIKVINDYKNSSEQDIVDFAMQARDKNIKYVRPIIVSEMRDSVADYIQEQTGIDTHGNNILLDRDSITHIDNEHKKILVSQK